MRITKEQHRVMPNELRVALDTYLWDVGVFYYDPSGPTWRPEWIEFNEGLISCYSINQYGKGRNFQLATNVQPPVEVLQYIAGLTKEAQCTA